MAGEPVVPHGTLLPTPTASLAPMAEYVVWKKIKPGLELVVQPPLANAITATVAQTSRTRSLIVVLSPQRSASLETRTRNRSLLPNRPRTCIATWPNASTEGLHEAQRRRAPACGGYFCHAPVRARTFIAARRPADIRSDDRSARASRAAQRRDAERDHSR